MITRDLQTRIEAAAKSFPVVTVTGPRQSGKTTLCRALFPDHRYVSLEPLDTRAFAEEDPRGFLGQFEGTDGVLLDEVQRVPSLFSYVQTLVDADPRPGRFVLTGSQHLGLSEAVAQSLAGRSAVLHLLPCTLDEVRRFPGGPTTLWDVVFAGGYPAIHDRAVPARDWLESYVATYVERDVRSLRNISDLTQFRTFMRLVAGRTSTLLSRSSLGADLGVDPKTAGAWLSVLEASWLLHRLPAWHRNISKRLVKSPRIHFLDSGLVCRLLGIRTSEELISHPLRGPIFESWVVSEVFKTWAHRETGAPPLCHLRTQKKEEIDLIIQVGDRSLAIEVKSGATANSDWLRHIRRFAQVLEAAPDVSRADAWVVFGGDTSEKRTEGEFVSWAQLPEQLDDWLNG